ncbi:ATP-binding cassette, subfamily B [Clostridium cavendishii DSM 21758]|uniref:ATP-binding cassette, subfamily B n=1 Tax=Clostridium cavendishii DSM 21758 TaxID=1121302 RepID=A0A1M6PAW9_9CLOT|nr:ABC transporter ATP-binding protein [Clostridium cavendishii]SHK05074.1 ATP-binding cassette, subfamily B [Clostridium cavendishii DSM 21758]
MKRILKYLLKHKALLLIPTLAMLVIIAIDSVTPYLQKMIIDNVIIGKETNLLMPIILGILGITLAKTVLGYVKEYLFDVLSAKVHQDIKIELFEHIQSLEFKFFDNINTGELMSRMSEDIENIWQTIAFGLRLFVENILYFVISSVILFCLNYKLALACIVVMIPIGYMAIKLEKKFGDCYGEISDQTAEINTAAQENIAGVRLVKAFAREKHEILKFLKFNRTYYDLNMKQAQTIGKYFPPMEFLTNISLVIMIIFGGYLIIKGELTLGTLVAFSTYIWSLIWPMRMLGWLTNILAQNQASAKKIFEILDRKPEIKNCEAPIIPETINGELEFKNVNFKYNDELILKNINLHINPGSTVAIMGTTGSGKSTILNLIGRYYDVADGEVLIDGINVKNLDLKTLRRNMSIVPQDTFLFSDTIKNNVLFSNKSASTEELLSACKASCALSFIEELQDGFETQIGERGIGLSGGQKQRIAIARALIRNAPILILDDSTSALDMETEYELLKNLNSRKTNATTFIIAHRISAVKNADMILYIEDGEIKEKGTHSELLAKKGFYYDIYCEQFKDFEKSINEEVV